MPSADVTRAHKHCSKHRAEITASKLCGCFYCLHTVPPAAIEYWLDEGDGTALCPKCTVDSVIGEASGFPVTVEFLLGPARGTFPAVVLSTMGYEQTCWNQ